MIDGFISTYKRLLQNTNYKHHRYIYKDFNTDNRLTGLIGPRGTEKQRCCYNISMKRLKTRMIVSMFR